MPVRRLLALMLVLGLGPGTLAIAGPGAPARGSGHHTDDSDAQPARRTTGDSIAVALEQSDCPLTLSPVDLVHDERGSTVRVRVLNEGSADVTRYTVSAWVVLPDGTVKGVQRFDQKQAIAEDAERQISLVIRTIRVAPTDTVILAVLDTQGDAWKGDAKALETEARAAAKK